MTEQVKTCASEIVKEVPEVANCRSVNSQTTESGETTWNTIAYECRNNKRIQVTVLVRNDNTDTTGVNGKMGRPVKMCTVVDNKEVFTKPAVTGCWKPEVMTYHIPKVAIAVTSRRKTEIKEVVDQIEKVHSTGTINSIDIESFGKADKVTAVVVKHSKKVEMTYIVNKETN